MENTHSLAARLQALEDIEAIKCLKYRYFQACDSKDPAAFRNCFADGEIVIEYGRIGSYSQRDELTQVFSELACHDHIIEMHHAQNPVIELISDHRARGSWSLYYYMINTRDRNTAQFGGIYRDEYVRGEPGWQMCSSEFFQTSTQLLDYNDEYVKILFGGRTAPATIDDPKQQS